MKVFKVFSVAMLVCTTHFANAAVVPYSTGDYLQKGIGAEWQSDYDILQITGKTNILDFIDTTTAPIAQYTYIVGPNCNSCSDCSPP